MDWRGWSIGIGMLGLAAAATAESVGSTVSVGDRASLRAPHGVPGSFFNPWASDPKTVWGLLKWQLSPNRVRSERSGPPAVPVVPNDGAYLAGEENSATITWVGHATFAIHDGNDVFLTDPHFGTRALIPKRVVPPGIPLESVPPDAFAILSHNHYDHLDADTVERLPASVAWYVPLGMAEWFRDRDRPNVVELDWWESAERDRWTITCLPSQHWSRRIGQGVNEALWCAWLVDSGDFVYFFAGDSGYFHGFEEFGRQFGPIDVAMLPIGAYEPRWFMKYQHMDPAEAYRAFRDLGAHTMLPMHWGTFDLTDEPVDLPPVILGQVIAEQGGDPERVRILAVGERWKISDHPNGESTQ
ncbi:MAG: MBL fold metallo-hydrolase [Proteobacteria bacterium]|nr:MBL fold metallo-hydrolase [Pseudomonadota bacterium]